jgi:hypothetical protein
MDTKISFSIPFLSSSSDLTDLISLGSKGPINANHLCRLRIMADHVQPPNVFGLQNFSLVEGVPGHCSEWASPPSPVHI